MDNSDPKNVLGSTRMLAEQCTYIWEAAKNLELPENFKNCKNIILCGMGGSAYGGYIVSALFKDSLKIPLISNNDYQLPAFADSSSLVLLSSYSGSTEESLSSGEAALEKGACIIGLTGGGKILEMSQDHHFPIFTFDKKFNPSGQPRLGTGYMVLGTIALLNKLKFISVSDDEAQTAIRELKENEKQIEETAKEMANKLYNNIPIIFAAEFLSGNIHIMRNQLNETAKSFSAYSELPELNHHLMEGFKNPVDKKLFVLFLSSDSYSEKLKIRLELTKDVVGKNNVEFSEYKPKGSSKLSEMLNVLSFGGYLSLYLAFLYKQDPSLIPWVDYFKEQLVK
jgi:glucose/mannose-6-phosphate isomerase